MSGWRTGIERSAVADSAYPDPEFIATVPTHYLKITNASKSFDTRVLDGVSLDVERGEVVALLGPSGSGKTTLLRIVAGFETADGGTIEVDGADITRLRPEERRCGMVFQHYALFPHLTVAENVAFGLKDLAKEESRARVGEMLNVVGLEGLEGRRVDQISGGQQQRVAVARALAPAPQVLLLDEPLSNLDPDLRERTRRQLREIVREAGITTLIVTHEQEEAFQVADRTAVLGDGRLRQVGTPEELYRRPADLFVASFIGRGTQMAARPGGTDGQWWIGAAAPFSVTEVWCPTAVEGEGVAWVRPESLKLNTEPKDGGWVGQVIEVRWHPRSSSVQIQLHDETEVEVAVDAETAESLASGQNVWVEWEPGGPTPSIFGAVGAAESGVGA